MDQQSKDEQNHHHIVDIPSVGVSSVGSSSQDASNSLDLPEHENRGARLAHASVVQSASTSNSSTNVGYPSIYKAVICIKLAYKMSLIFASMVVLIVSRHDKPQCPWFGWILAYMIGCAATVPIIFRHHFIGRFRLFRLLEHLRWLLEYFLAFWFLLGNYWIFTEDSPSRNGNLYKLCVSFIVLDYVKYIGPFILSCMVVCCCRGLLNQVSGAPAASISDLPTYRFKLLNNGASSHDQLRAQGGGVVAAGTEKECSLLGEDAICCICLANYEDNDELKELPCSHMFHASCVDTWLKIKAFCPLCKFRVDNNTQETSSASNPHQRS